LLVSLVAIYRLIGNEDWQVRWPFSLYLGWISVATIANASAMQSALGWLDLGMMEASWTLLKLAIAGAVASVIVVRRHDTVFGLVVAWAAFGISSGQAATPAVAGAASLLLYLVSSLLVYDIAKQYFNRQR
jgi:cell division protein FtsX